jgi:integrase
MTALALLDATGRRRSPATLPGYHCGRAPRNKGRRYPADPPPVEEIIAVMRHAGDSTYGVRTRALIVLLWRAGLRVSEALALAESDLDRSRGAVLVRHGKGGKRREVGMDPWAGNSLSRGSSAASSCRSARCCASSPAQPPDAPGQAPPPATPSGTSPPTPASVAASPRARGRDGSRGRAAQRYSATTRTRRAAARTEWRLITAIHNLFKLWRHTTTPQPA